VADKVTELPLQKLVGPEAAIEMTGAVAVLITIGCDTLLQPKLLEIVSV
jgi:hypothetical protein